MMTMIEGSHKTMIRNYWTTIAARLKGLWCIVCGHDIEWFYSPDDMCSGDIVCNTCNQLIWCRWHDPWRKEPPEDYDDAA